MTDRRRHRSGYLLKRLAAARAVLEHDPDYRFTDQQRCFARKRLNRTLAVLRALPPIPAMKRGLEVDRLAEKRRIA